MISALTLVISALVVIIFLAGFYCGTNALRNYEDTELLDAVDYHQFDLVADTTDTGWRTYHPTKNHNYVMKTHPDVRTAIRDFIENHAE